MLKLSFYGLKFQANEGSESAWNALEDQERERRSKRAAIHMYSYTEPILFYYYIQMTGELRLFDLFFAYFMLWGQIPNITPFDLISLNKILFSS